MLPARVFLLGSYFTAPFLYQELMLCPFVILSLPFLSVFGRCHILRRFEQLDEIIGIRDPAHFADLMNGLVCEAEQLLAPVDPEQVNAGVDALAVLFLELAAQIILRYVEHLRQIFQRDVLSEVGLQIMQDLVQLLIHGGAGSMLAP